MIDDDVFQAGMNLGVFFVTGTNGTKVGVALESLKIIPTTKAMYTSLRGDVYIYTYYDINRIILLLPIGSLYSAASTSTIFNQKQEESSSENASNMQTELSNTIEHLKSEEIQSNSGLWT